MRLKITKFRLLAFLAGYTALVNIMALLKGHLGLLSVIISFPYLIVVPGLLTLIALRLKSADIWRTFFYAISLSLVLLMIIGLTADWVLPLLGIKQVLQTVPLLATLNVFMAGLLVWARSKARLFSRTISLQWRTLDYSYLAPLLFIVLAACGAIRLNNGASNILTLLLLGAIIGDFYYLYKRARGLPESKIIFHIFCIALSMLLITSLRGWFITGHDVQREYFVFELAKSNWHWQVSLFRDPYNACLSITILPTMFASLLKIADPYIYKVLFQIVFAICPVGVYLLVSKISNRRLALLSVLYFVAFPTFFTDMPMLNRQEIAFIFFGAMLLLLTEKKLRYNLRVMLFGAYGIGVILAHYSTTYALLLIFMTACFVRFIFEKAWFKRLAAKFFKKVHRTMPDFIGPRRSQRLIVVPMVIFFALAAFLWNVQITRTSSGLIDTLKNAARSITSNIREDSRSSDTGASLFGGTKVDPAVLLKGYAKEQETVRNGVDQTNYYPRETYQQYKIAIAPDKPLPLTRLGRIVTKLGINVYDFNYNLRQSFAKILQILVLIGLCLLFFSKRLRLHPGSEYVAVSITSIMFLTLLVFVPVLSVDYGLLRAFQQVLIVLALPTSIGSLAVASVVSKKYSVWLTFGLAALFFLASTGFIAELTGGYVAPLYLHNSGTYYDSYYFHPGENYAIKWVSETKDSNNLDSDVEADRIAGNRIQIFGKFTTQSDIYPGLVQKDSYVYLGYTNIVKGTAYALYQNEGVQYTYPVKFLDDNKNLLYSNQQSRIYK